MNRGFGGSTYADLIHFAHRIVIPYAPATIVVYSGDNDVAGGKKAEQVFADFKTFVGLVHKDLPKTRILVIGIKPSIARWALFGEMRKANSLIRAHAEQNARLIYIDSEAPMLGGDGMPRRDLLLKDGLHMNDEGYAIWTALVMPHLKQPGGAKPT